MLDELARGLAFAGLIIASGAYYVVVRRRKRDSDEAAIRSREASQRRARARFRHLERHDHE